MMDYRCCVVALDVFQQALAARSFSNPAMAQQRDAALKQASTFPGHACLGALAGHLLWHAGSDGAELALVERAAALWAQGLQLYTLLGTFRRDLESALVKPADAGAAGLFISARQAQQALLTGMTGKEAEVAMLRDDIFEAAHPRAHPRQHDQRLASWTWGDVFAARRTDAFARAAWASAPDDAGKAIGLGAMAGYGAHAGGAGYLGQVVGGPRRAHRHRDRVARNAVGSALARTHPAHASLSAMADLCRLGATGAALPAAVEEQLAATLAATYDFAKTAPPPDLQLGYRRLLRHLDALAVFVLPPDPALPLQPFLNQMYGDTAAPSLSVVAAMLAVEDAASSSGSGSGGGGGGVTPRNVPHGSAPGSQDAPANSKLDCGAGFEALFRFIAFVGTFGGPCWEPWAAGTTCPFWEDTKAKGGEFWASLWGGQGTSTGSTGSLLQVEPTEAALRNLASSGAIVDVLHGAYDLHKHFRETLEGAYAYLAICGLIYPDEVFHKQPYPQFVTVPARAEGAWPHRAVDDAANEPQAYPHTPVEQPALAGMPYPPGSPPTRIFSGGNAGSATPAHIAMATWMQTVDAILDASNYDLDADRGPLHPCWDVAGAIDDQPVNAVVLDYKAT